MSANRNNQTDDLSVYAEEEEKKKKPTLSEARKAQYDTLYANYVADTSALDEQKNLAQQEARINHELLMKYLPTLNKQNGLYGLGVAQSANVEALANYQNNLNAIDRNYRTSKSELDRSWNNSQLSLYDQQATEDREDSLAAYNEAYDLIVAGAETKTKDEIYNYINSLGVDEATKERLGSLANYLYGDAAEEQKGERYTAKGAFGTDGVVNVNLNGANVSLMQGEPVSLPAKATNGINEGEVFTYNNGIYIKKNGVVTQLLDENGGYTGSGYSDVYKYLTTGKASEVFGPYISDENTRSEDVKQTFKSTSTDINAADVTWNDGKGTLNVDGKTLTLTLSDEKGVSEDGHKDGKVFVVYKLEGDSQYGIPHVFLNGKLYTVYESKPTATSKQDVDFSQYNNKKSTMSMEEFMEKNKVKK